MTTNKKTLEVLRAGLDSTMNLMDEKSMDAIAGGWTCKKNYCHKSYCPKKYDSSDPDSCDKYKE